MMYEITVPPIAQMLGALSGILAKTEAHCTARRIDPAVLLGFRLYPDMLNLTRQVQLTCDFGARAVARLTGAEVPAFPDVETTLPELQARIAAALAVVNGAPEAAFDGAAGRSITIRMRGEDVTMPGLAFLTRYALPQIYFHATVAHAILRHNGVEIGKRDFMGAA